MNAVMSKVREYAEKEDKNIFKDIKGNYRIKLGDEESSIFINVEDVYCAYKNPLDGSLSVFFKSGTELEISLNE